LEDFIFIAEGGEMEKGKEQCNVPPISRPNSIDLSGNKGESRHKTCGRIWSSSSQGKKKTTNTGIGEGGQAERYAKVYGVHP